MKKMMVGLSTAFILLVSISSSVFADGETANPTATNPHT